MRCHCFTPTYSNATAIEVYAIDELSPCTTAICRQIAVQMPGYWSDWGRDATNLADLLGCVRVFYDGDSPDSSIAYTSTRGRRAGESVAPNQ